MWKYIRQYRFYITLFAFLLIPIIALDTSTRSPRQYRFYDKIFAYLTYPIQATITWSLEGVVSLYQNYVYLLDTKKQNQALLNENRRLLNTIVNLRETQNENDRLRKLLNFKEENQLKAVIARVIAKDVSKEFRVIRINRGNSHGVKKDMPVVNSEGVVGRVLRTTHRTSDIVTILDSLSAVDSIVKRSRVRGIVEGKSDTTCQLKYALRTDDVEPADVLISSGLGGVFPKGIPVGKVLAVNRQPYGITQKVDVEPSVDFSRLEEVMIITEKITSPIHVTTDPKFPPEAPELAPPKKEETAGEVSGA